MTKKTIGFITAGIVIIGLIFWLNPFAPGQSSTVRVSRGTISQEELDGVKFWGFNAAFSFAHPFYPRHLRLSDLPSEWQKDGERVEITYIIDDVVAMGKWGDMATVIKVRN